MAKRRYNGEGHISKYKRGGKNPWVGWRGVYTDPNTGGQRSVYGKTQAICAEKLNKKLEEIRKGAYVEPSGETVESWLDRWFNDYYTIESKPSTAATAESNIRVHLKPAFGHIKLQKLNCDDLQQFIREKSKSLKPSTVDRMLSIFHKAILQAIYLQKINRDPFIGLKKPKKEKAEINPLTRDEQTAWLKCVPSTTSGRALKFLLNTGMRVSELVGLRWCDIQSDGIHVERNVLTIRDLQEDGYTDIEGTPKTESGKRVIPYNKNVRQLLEEQRRAQIEDRFRARGSWIGGDPGKGDCYVFTTRTGNHSDRNNINRLYRTTLEKAGISKRGVHSLRHTFATNAVQLQVPISDLSKMLGHSDPAFTIRTYVHPDRDGMQWAMERLGELNSLQG